MNIEFCVHARHAQCFDMLKVAMVKSHLKIHYRTQYSECNATIIASLGGHSSKQKPVCMQTVSLKGKGTYCMFGGWLQDSTHVDHIMLIVSLLS